MRPSVFDNWSEVDQGEAMALILDEESRCSCGCGQYKDVCMSRDYNWDVRHHKCYAGAALDQVRRQFDKDHKDDPGRHDGRLWSVTPVPTQPPSASSASSIRSGQA